MGRLWSEWAVTMEVTVGTAQVEWWHFSGGPCLLLSRQLSGIGPWKGGETGHPPGFFLHSFVGAALQKQFYWRPGHFVVHPEFHPLAPRGLWPRSWPLAAPRHCFSSLWALSEKPLVCSISVPMSSASGCGWQSSCSMKFCCINDLPACLPLPFDLCCSAVLSEMLSLTAQHSMLVLPLTPLWCVARLLWSHLVCSLVYNVCHSSCVLAPWCRITVLSPLLCPEYRALLALCGGLRRFCCN
jgi:hypothetical protein